MGRATGVGRVLKAEIVSATGATVAVEFAIADGRLADVRVRGWDRVNLADTLNRLPADLEAGALAARMRAAVPFGTDLDGLSFTDLAKAIRGAVGTPAVPRIGSFTAAEVDALTDRWRAYPWRLLPERPLSAARNVAVDELLSDRGSPTLRFWNWTEPAVVIGRCQSVRNEVDAAAMEARGVKLVRRLTGGGAMFVQPHGTITYSLVLPEEAVSGLTIRQSYEACDAWVVRGLRQLGADVHHVPVNDLAWAGGKIGGAAQARRRGGVLHHTTLAYDLKADEMASVLRIGRQRVANAVASAAKVVSPLTDQLRRSREDVVGHLFASFRDAFGGEIDAFSDDELATAEELVRTKYGHAGWTHEFA